MQKISLSLCTLMGVFIMSADNNLPNHETLQQLVETVNQRKLQGYSLKELLANGTIIIQDHQTVGAARVIVLSLKGLRLQSLEGIEEFIKAAPEGSTYGWIDLSHNLLTEFPRELMMGFEGVSVLKLSYNHITEVPAVMFGLRSLKLLDLSYNKLQDFPHDKWFDQFDKHAKINLTGNNKLSKKVLDRSLMSLLAKDTENLCNH